nr:hypothetical protein [uncultured Peptostreptococcus sp.]
MEEMGMTDKQFNGFLRMLIKVLKDVNREENEFKKSEKLEDIIADLQKTLED